LHAIKLALGDILRRVFWALTLVKFKRITIVYRAVIEWLMCRVLACGTVVENMI